MTRPASPPAPHRGELEIVAGSVLISFSAVFVRLADIGPTAAGVYRNLFGAMALLALVALRRDRLWKGMQRARWVLLAGACFTADIYFWHRSINYVGPGLATILGNFQVFFLAATGILVFHERATLRFLLAVPLAVVGLFLLVGLHWGDFDATYRRGVLFGLLTAASYAAYLLCLRAAGRERDRLSAVANMAGVSVVTATLLTVIATVQSDSLRIPDARTLLILVAYGVLCQAIGWIIISRRLREVDASRASLILLLQPSLTLIWDILFFGRPTAPVEAGGALLALIAIYLGSVRPRAAAPAGGSP